MNIYAIAHKVWDIAKKIWLTIVIVLLISLVANVAVVQTTDLSKTVLAGVLQWFALFELVQILLIGILALFLVIIPSAARIIIAVEGHSRKGKALQAHLQKIATESEILNSTGFDQESSFLASISVPLDAVFIHLRAVADRPRYEIPYDQEQLIQELYQRADLSEEERERMAQKLRARWYSDDRGELTRLQQRDKVDFKEIIQQLTAANLVAVILGTPGSGKSTVVGWFARQMALAYLPSRHHLPRELSPKQFPILFRISDYSELLATREITFEEFFTQKLAQIHPDLPVRLLEALENGDCLVLFDGLDEVARDDLRRQVSDNIYAFISRYAPREATAKHFNRFIMTSRIVGYEARKFADSRCTHYTLLDLGDEQIKGFLRNWCPAAVKYRTQAGQPGRKLTRQQEEDAERRGNEQQARLLEAINKHSSIKLLAINPLMLTIMALIQHTGHQLPHRRIEL